jgi:outer membrane protein
MKQVIKISVLAVALSVLSPICFASTSSNIAVIDAPSVINQTKAAEEAREILRLKTTEAQTKIDAMEEELTELKEELEQKRAVMSEEKYTEANLKLSQQVRDFRNKAQSIQEDLDRQNILLKKQITDELSNIVDEIAKEKEYDVVVAKHLLLFSTDTIDISDEVLKRLDKRMAEKKKSEK